ncbi:MAG TPA: hypothetical protein VGJ13_20665 [Pseudonocardiaceae bacterium]
MSNVHEVRWRLLWEQLVQVYQQAQRQESETLPDGLLPEGNVEILLRLAGAALALLEWHALDGNSRCQVWGCSRRRWVPWRKRRTCQVFVTVQFWMRQPLWIVQKTGRDW